MLRGRRTPVESEWYITAVTANGFSHGTGGAHPLYYLIVNPMDHTSITKHPMDSPCQDLISMGDGGWPLVSQLAGVMGHLRHWRGTEVLGKVTDRSMKIGQVGMGRTDWDWANGPPLTLARIGTIIVEV